MTGKMLRPYSLLLYFLAIFVGFFLGVMYAGWIEAGKGQMLAAGAIVLGYGVVGAFIGFVTSLVVARWGSREVREQAGRRTIIGLNGLLALLLAGFFIYFTVKYQRKHAANSMDILPETELPEKTKVPKKMISPVVDQHEISSDAVEFPKTKTAKVQPLHSFNPSSQPVPDIGLGMFAPHTAVGAPLYFYGHPIQGWPAPMEDIVDSVTFHKDQYDNLAIATAPPWFVPIHEKMDYGFMFMKIRTVYRHTLEVEVNKMDGRTALVSNESGRVIYWPEFLLSVYSIELLDEDSQKIRVKPLDYAGETRLEYEFLRPVAIRADWVKVELKNSDLKTIGEGWVKWRENGRLLVRYSLLS